MFVTQLPRSLAKLLCVVVLLAAIHFPLTAAVLAHADYDRSVPAADEVVSQAPQQVQVWFTQDLFRREGLNSLEVYGPDDQRVDLDDAAIDDDNRELMTVSLQSDLANGVYTVRWRTFSADDGDDADGDFQFTIQADEPEAEAAPTAAPTAVPTAVPTVAPTVTPTEATESEQPSPTSTAQAESTEPLSTPPAPDQASEDAETPAGQADQGPGIPCMGSSAPLLLLLGTFLLTRRRRKIGERQSDGASHSLNAKSS